MTSLVGRYHGEPQLVAELRYRAAGIEQSARPASIPWWASLPYGSSDLDPFYLLSRRRCMMMTFLSFFIGIFLQLMWEELPITEPL